MNARRDVSPRSLQLYLAVALCAAAAVLAAPGAAHPMWNELYWWLFAAAVVCSFVVEKGDPAVLGIRARFWRGLGIGVVGAVGVIALAVLVSTIVLPALHLSTASQQTMLQQIGTMSLPMQIAVAMRAGVVEEVVYRGYPIGRGEQVMGSKIAALLLSTLAFTVPHLSRWGATHLIFVAAAGFFLGMLFMWKRNLWANIVAHSLADLLMFLGASAAARGHP